MVCGTNRPILKIVVFEGSLIFLCHGYSGEISDILAVFSRDLDLMAVGNVSYG